MDVEGGVALVNTAMDLRVASVPWKSFMQGSVLFQGLVAVRCACYRLP